MAASSPPPPIEKQTQFHGDYPFWADAAKRCSGYGAHVILERTRAAMLKIKSGEADYERDSVTFEIPEYPFPLIACVLRAAMKNDDVLNILDFGGALGSSYYQCRKFLGQCRAIQWAVIEQPSHVACGKKDFESSELTFHETISACPFTPNVVLASSVLQYLPYPYAILRELLVLKASTLIIDRTAFINQPTDRLSIQTVPDWIYPASYPAWFFNENKFRDNIESAGYKLFIDFPGFDVSDLPGPRTYYKGLVYELANE